MRERSSFFVPILLLFMLPGFASAESVTLRTAKQIYRAGDSFELSLNIDVGSQSINTISGKIRVPADFFQVSNLRYGNSIVSLWVEKPAIDQAGSLISFAGGIPGGFNSRVGQVLTFVLKAKKTGSATINLENVEVLLNDGQGTPLTPLETPKLTLSILEPLPVSKPPVKTTETELKPEPKQEAYVPPPDNTPPESFIPLVSRHENIGDNRYFVSFSAVDKDSGLARYEVREIPLYLELLATDWIKSNGELYILNTQYWPAKVLIRAYDQSGNFTEGYADKPMSPLLSSILVGSILAILFYLWKLSTISSIKSISRVVKSKNK